MIKNYKVEESVNEKNVVEFNISLTATTLCDVSVIRRTIDKYLMEDGDKGTNTNDK